MAAWWSDVSETGQKLAASFKFSMILRGLSNSFRRARWCFTATRSLPLMPCNGELACLTTLASPRSMDQAEKMVTDVLFRLEGCLLMEDE